MDLSFHPLTLDAVDAAAAESLCLFIASDERPLTGLAGLADWRLSGKLSRLLRAGLLTGEAGEAVLTPATRLGFKKLFLFGVGPLGQPEEKLTDRIAEALRKLGQAGVQEAAMQLPARLSADAGIRALVNEQEGPARAMVFGPDPQKLVAALGRRVSSPPPVTASAEQRPLRSGEHKPVVKPALPQQQMSSLAAPKPSPVPFAPQPAPAPLAPPPQQPLPVAPPVQPPPSAPVLTSGERKALPPSQRYVPPPPKPHVFEKKKKKR